MKRNPAIIFAICCSLIATAGVTDRRDTFGDPLPGLTPALIKEFNSGRDEFVDVETVADGLGPVFNGRSCAECHSVPVTGGGSERTEIRFGTASLIRC